MVDKTGYTENRNPELLYKCRFINVEYPEAYFEEVRRLYSPYTRFQTWDSNNSTDCSLGQRFSGRQLSCIASLKANTRARGDRCKRLNIYLSDSGFTFLFASCWAL